MLNATSTQNIQGVEYQKKKENGIIIKYCSLNYINTKPRCRELPKIQNTRVDIEYYSKNTDNLCNK